MKFCLPFILMLCLLSATSLAQIIDATPRDSLTLRFSDTTFEDHYGPDTASATLWQIGRTHKTFFTEDTNGVIAIMTDTLNHYPINCNNSFTLLFAPRTNITINFWHRYQTDTGHDGGVVEYSVDEGETWQNVRSECNADAGGPAEYHGVRTYNFYTFNDTIPSAGPAFSGTDTARFSRLQFFNGWPSKSTSGHDCPGLYPDRIRFRFVSDTTADTLAGWMIDSIKVEQDYFGEGYVDQTSSARELIAYPNPSLSGHFIFPALKNEHLHQTDIYNAIGQKVHSASFSRELDISNLPPGLYYYHITDGWARYSGKLLYGQ